MKLPRGLMPLTKPERKRIAHENATALFPKRRYCTRDMSLRDRMAHYTLVGAGCWEWMGGKDGRGYGSVSVPRALGERKSLHSRMAHRVAFELAHGPIPAGLHVCHRCDNPPCVRPDHLFLGTDKDNQDDKVAKGRQLRGERCHNAKLDREAVVLMRREWNGTTQHISQMAEIRGVSYNTVKRALRGESWSHAS